MHCPSAMELASQSDEPTSCMSSHNQVQPHSCITSQNVHGVAGTGAAAAYEHMDITASPASFIVHNVQHSSLGTLCDALVQQFGLQLNPRTREGV